MNWQHERKDLVLQGLGRENLLKEPLLAFFCLAAVFWHSDPAGDGLGVGASR